MRIAIFDVMSGNAFRSALLFTAMFSSGASVAAPAVAVQQQLWRFPCDVFLGSACFRLPARMSMSYEVPADFGIYEISSGDAKILTVYSGSAPSRQDRRRNPDFKLESSGHVLTVFVTESDGVDRFDLFLDSTNGQANTVHVFGVLDAGNRTPLIHFVSGLRPCERLRRRQFTCPVESAWGKQVEERFRFEG